MKANCEKCIYNFGTSCFSYPDVLSWKEFKKLAKNRIELKQTLNKDSKCPYYKKYTFAYIVRKLFEGGE